ncbi:MAG: acyltransferase [Planctomycetes bacterium]|nr:acyltransferase [Planctomycetota bacterium]
MNEPPILLADEELKLWRTIQRLHTELRGHTWNTYSRVNPFVENLFEWKGKGEFFGGRDVTIYDSTTVVGDVEIGDHTWIGPFCSLDGTASLRIGHHCSISLGTQVLTHDTMKWALTGGKAAAEYEPVSIGDCCFVGSHCVITKGVSIGNHCVIGAGAVVTRSIEDCSVAVGVPARTVGRVILKDEADIEIEYFAR